MSTEDQTPSVAPAEASTSTAPVAETPASPVASSPPASAQSQPQETSFAHAALKKVNPDLNLQLTQADT
jgi:hypothetical protein